MTLLGLVSALALPASASAHHGAPTFERTFRFESRLCAMVDAGKVPVPLQGSEAQVKEACTALHSAFDAAVSGAGGDNGAALKEAVGQVQTACGGDAVDRGACADALRNAYKQLKSSRRGNKRAYKRALREAQRAFRQSIKALLHHEEPKHEEPKPDEPAGDEPTGDAPTGDAPVFHKAPTND